MENKQITDIIDIKSLQAKILTLEDTIAQKDVVINTKDALISEKEEIISKKQEIISKKQEIISQKQTSISNLENNISYLEYQIKELQRMIYGSKRERFIPQMDANQLRLEFEPQTQEISQAVKQERERIRVEYQRSKPKKKPQGRMPLPAHLPVNEIVIEPTEDTTGMVCIGHEVTDELDYTPTKLHINRYIRPKYITKEDERGYQKQVIAALNRPINKCIASVALLAMIYVEKYVFHIPLYRILKKLELAGVKIPSSTFESWVKLGAELIRPLYALHRLYVFREIYQMIDESPIKVQDGDKKGKCHLGYMWVRYAALSKAVLFEYYKSRSAKGPIDDLHTFTGFVQTDGYSGYTFLAMLDGIVHLSCWAHARRYFEKALGNDKERASYVLERIQLLYAIEALAREKNMTHVARHALRLEKSLPILNEIGKYIAENKDCVAPKSPIGVAFEYCSNRWISLMNYLKNGMLEIDSNLIENSIRPLALGRKNYLFAGSHDAAENIAMFYSFFQTCRKHDIDPQKWLVYVMNHINDTKQSELKNLLPQFIDKNLFG